MIILSTLAEANKNLFRSKLRSFLTMLAITVGSFVIIISLAIQTGVKNFVDQQFESFGGDNIIEIFPQSVYDARNNPLSSSDAPKKYDENNLGTTTLRSISPQQQKDIKNISGIKADTVEKQLDLSIDYVADLLENHKYNLNVSALPSKNYQPKLASGKVLDQDSKQNEILLPPKYIESLGFSSPENAQGRLIDLAIKKKPEATPPTPDLKKLPQSSPNQTKPATADKTKAAGDQAHTKSNPESPTPNHTKTKSDNQIISSGDNKYTLVRARIVGVLAENSLGFNTNTAYLNQHLAKTIYEQNNPTDSTHDNSVYYLVAEYDPSIASIESIKGKLSRMGLHAISKNDALENTHNFLNALAIILYIFGATALLAAAIGIVNTLIMSTQERTKEIGLSKALGRSSFKIFSVFSCEAIMLGFWGSALGTCLAYILGTLADDYLHRSGQILAAFPDFHVVSFTALNVSIVIGIVMLVAFCAGVIPAQRASRKNPIEALRYE